MGDRTDSMNACPFCSPAETLLDHPLAFALADRYPASPGHTLIIVRRHVADFFDTTAAEQRALLALLREARRLVDARHAPQGYNIGVNIGATAGQTIAHVHVHLIPRYAGDVADPRGGVRGVIPHRQSY
jgi:diadenosine tetraphosphate (Ap4A) HIT family hydrolase